MSVLDDFTRKKKAAALLILINLRALDNELLQAQYRLLQVIFCFISNCHSLIAVEKQLRMLFTLTIYSYATIAWVWLFLEFMSLNSLSNISRLKSRKSLISKIQVARPGIQYRTPCSASHELKHSPTTAPFSTIALDKRYVHDAMKHTMRQKEKATQPVL